MTIEETTVLSQNFYTVQNEVILDEIMQRVHRITQK